MSATSSLDTAYWKRLDALLEIALGLPVPERRGWLEALDGEHEACKPAIAAMLARTDSDAFMEMPVGAATLDAAADAHWGERPGDHVGPYRLLQRCGSGGMGTVWLAERADGTVQRRVALKLPRAGWSQGLAERLKRECDILAGLEHPGIARLYDAGLTDQGRPYLAMEWIDGVPLDKYCREGNLDLEARLRLFQQIARALAHAHAHLVVHRDLKPANILVDGQGVVHLVDFGLAKTLESGGGEVDGAVTQLAGRAFTPEYASPERIRGERDTVGGDVYSLGVVLYEMLSGHRPYEVKRNTAAALEEAILEAEVPLASRRALADRRLSRALRGDLDTLLAKALRKNPAERYPTMEAFAADAERYLRGEPLLAQPDSLAYRARKFVRRNARAVAAAAVAASLGIAGLAAIVHQANVASASAHQAALQRDRAVRELHYSEAISEFMRFLLSEQSAQPVPAPQLLQRAEESVARQYARHPALLARMQIQVAELHGELTDYRRAEATLRSALESARASGDADLLMQAECVFAGMLGATARVDEALAGFERAMAGAPRGNEDTTRQVCLVQRATLYRNIGRLQESSRDIDAAIAGIGEQSPGKYVSRLLLHTKRADIMARSGAAATAVDEYDQAMGELARIGRAQTSAGLSAANNLLVLLTRAGQLQRAADLHTRFAIGTGPEQHPAFATLAINFAKVLTMLGRPEEAEPLLVRALALKVRQGDKRGEAFAHLELAMAACAPPRRSPCESRIAEAARKLGELPVEGRTGLASLKVLSARLVLDRGDAPAAAKLVESALSEYGVAHAGTPFAAKAWSLLALARQRAGDAAGAQAASTRAIEVARDLSAGFPHSEGIGSALLARASLLAESGNPTEAKWAAAQAREHLSRSAGEDAAPTRAVDALLKRLG